MLTQKWRRYSRKTIRFRTKTPQEVRRTLNKVMNMTVNGEIEPIVANSIIKACNAVLIAIRIDEQGKKIEELDRLLKSLSNKK